MLKLLAKQYCNECRFLCDLFLSLGGGNEQAAFTNKGGTLFTF